MKIHRLKTWEPYYSQVARGEKPFEIRINDRGFEVGDALILERYDPIVGAYSGGHQIVLVTCVVESASCPFPFLKDGVVVMGIRRTVYGERTEILREDAARVAAERKP